MKNWFKLKGFESFITEKLVSKSKNKLLLEGKSIKEIRKVFESFQKQDLDKSELARLGLEHGAAFKEAGYDLEDAHVYSETHDINYIDGFKSAFGKDKI